MRKHLRWFYALVILLLLAGCSTPQETVTLLPPPTQPSTQGADSPAATPAAPTLPAATGTPAPTETPVPSPTPSGPQAVLQEVINQVEMHASADQDWQPAALNMIVYQGGEVWAKEASTALLGLGGENIRVAPDTLFSMSQPDENTLQIDLQEGQIWLNVEGLEAGENFEVETPTAVASVRGTRFSARVESDGASVFSSWEGSVEVSNALGTVTLQAGQQTAVAPGKAPAPASPISDDEWLRWGMAQGPSLTPLLPLVGTPHIFYLPGESSGHTFAAGSNQLSFTTYDPATAGISFYFYNTETGESIMPSLGPNAVDPIYNPLSNNILYANAGFGGSELCSANLDGSDPLCFAQSPDYIYMFAPSPDWQWVALTRDSATGRDLFLIHPDGTEETLLASHTGAEINYPAWSSDSTRLAYVVSAGAGQAAELWWTAVDGSTSGMLFDQVKPQAYSQIAWSPDGQWLSAPGFSGGLWIVRTDGSQAVQVDTRSGSYWAVSWTPAGGGWPLFYHLIDSGLYYLPAHNAQPVFFGSTELRGPFWNADSSTAAFYTNQLIDGAYQTRLYFYHALLDFLPAAP